MVVSTSHEPKTTRVQFKRTRARMKQKRQEQKGTFKEKREKRAERGKTETVTSGRQNKTVHETRDATKRLPPLPYAP